MRPLYLKFASEQEAKDILYTAQTTMEYPESPEDEPVVVPVLDDEGEPLFTPNYVNISTIGIMYNDDAVFGEDDEGMPTVITPATAKDGWHVNILVLADEDEEVLMDYSVDVSTPSRVWGGH